MDPIQQRLTNQGIARPRFRRADEVVAWLGAVQAQEYQPSKWALGLRLRGATDADVERAVTGGEILRTHVLRPTWHYVAAADLVWMQRLTGPRVQRAMEVYRRQLELDGATMQRATTVFERALRDRRHLTRPELGERLRRAGIALSGVRLMHAALYAELEAVICSGPRADKHATYALVAERVVRPLDLAGDEALAELTRRFFRSHGPATIRDFVWWSGLRTADARRGLDIIRAAPRELDGHVYWSVPSRTASLVAADSVHLLPIYDEYLVAYRDRLAVPHGPATLATSAAGSVTFQHAVVIDGHVAGTWRVDRSRSAQVLRVIPLRRLAAAECRGLEAEAEHYGRFTGISVSLSIG